VYSLAHFDYKKTHIVINWTRTQNKRGKVSASWSGYKLSIISSQVNVYEIKEYREKYSSVMHAVSRVHLSWSETSNHSRVVQRSGYLRMDRHNRWFRSLLVCV